MNRNANVLARLMLTQLPGLVGAMQLAAVASPSLSELARRQRNQNMTNALLSRAAGLLAPRANYPLMPPPRLGIPAPQVEARRKPATKPAEGLTADALAGQVAEPARLAGRSAMHRQGAPRVPRLREFTGILASRLDSPAVLPGGWKLYGYERGTDSPVYIGPGRQLRVYA